MAVSNHVNWRGYRYYEQNRTDLLNTTVRCILASKEN